MSEPTIVCVLGMHRSGTSVVTRLLNVLGLYLGPEDHLMRPGPANPAGHWESREIKNINEEILSTLGGTWDDPPEFTAGWERSPELAAARRQARELIESDFAGSDLWGFKDPRSCLTAPFWKRIVGPMRYLICLRNPLDVAASLEAREHEPVPFERGAELWLTYVRAALAASAGHPREFVFYEDVMADPERVVSRLARFIGAGDSETAEEDYRVATAVAMSESLWHHRTSVPNVVDASLLSFHVKALYLALRQFVASVEGIGAEVLDLLGNYAADAQRQVAEADVAREELERLRRESLDHARERARLEHALSERDAELEHAADVRRDLELELAKFSAELERLQQAADDAKAEESEAAIPVRGSESRLPQYERLVAEVRVRAEELIPPESTVLVASKGDNALLELNGRRARHFPSDAEGRYAGYHPSGDTAAIAHLEALRAGGADHLLLPAPVLWWLDHYQGLRRHLEERYTPLLEDQRCAVFALRAENGEGPDRPILAVKRAIAGLRIRLGRDPSILDWDSGLGLAEHLPELAVFRPPGEEPALPYLDATIDVVVVASTEASRTAEARRVATSAVIEVDPGSTGTAGIEWLTDGSAAWGGDVSVTLLPNGESGWQPALRALGETLAEDFAGEITVVGHPSALQAATAAGPVVRFRSIETAVGASVIERAQLATEATSHRTHVFMTAPAVPLPDWLPSMLALFSERNAALVGGRVLSPDGALKAAGGLLAPDGSLRGRGEGDVNPDRPAYRFVDRVDFCSPPLFATRAELVERLAAQNAPRPTASDDLSDLSLRAARGGAPVYYQPQARVVAIEERGP